MHIGWVKVAFSHSFCFITFFSISEVPFNGCVVSCHVQVPTLPRMASQRLSRHKHKLRQSCFPDRVSDSDSQDNSFRSVKRFEVTYNCECFPWNSSIVGFCSYKSVTKSSHIGNFRSSIFFKEPNLWASIMRSSSGSIILYHLRKHQSRLPSQIPRHVSNFVPVSVLDSYEGYLSTFELSLVYTNLNCTHSPRWHLCLHSSHRISMNKYLIPSL